MMEILHSFGAGIAFAFGVMVAVVLCRAVTREDRKSKEHQAKMEARLSKSVEAQQDIAASLNELVKMKGYE